LGARLLLVAAVLVLAVGGVFVVSSILVRMRKGQWLRRAGPFEIGEPEISDVESEVEHWRSIAVASQEAVSELMERVQAAQELTEEVRQKASIDKEVQFE
jgi:hypothetical protein